MVYRAIHDATQIRLDGLDLRKVLHAIPEQEKQDVLRPLFANVRPARGYLALAALGRYRPITVINLNWDTALAQACEQAGVKCKAFDINEFEENKDLMSLSAGVVDIHVHGIIGKECRYGTIETLNFSHAQVLWLLEHGLANTTVILGASLHDETDLTVLFGKLAESSGSWRPASSQWFFVRGQAVDTVEDRMRHLNARPQSLTYVRDPDIDFDTVATLITDRAVGTIRGAATTRTN